MPISLAWCQPYPLKLQIYRQLKKRPFSLNIFSKKLVCKNTIVYICTLFRINLNSTALSHFINKRQNNEFRRPNNTRTYRERI